MDTPPTARGTSELSSSGLPIPLTSFVGRTDELELARSLLHGPERRLLTLTGPGGIGKTRLAIEIATHLAADYPDGVCFVPLAAIQHHELVMPAIATALGLRELDLMAAPDAIVSLIGHSRRLLVVDNVEHVVEAAPALVDALTRCPLLKLLVTSREPLHVSGEVADALVHLREGDAKAVGAGRIGHKPRIRARMPVRQACRTALSPSKWLTRALHNFGGPT